MGHQSVKSTATTNMKYLLVSFCVVAASAQRRGRQEEVAAYGDAALDSYAADDAGEDPLAALASNIPGVPGEDYPIYAEVPESGFSCEGQVDGGYYADPEAECQAFHICTADGAGGLAKYSFLCPNGTLFNQNYFICDWWFNFDCATAEDLYSLNDEIAAERDALAGDAGLAGYGAPSEYAAGSGDAPIYEGGAPVRRGRGRKLGGSRRTGRRQGSSKSRRGGKRRGGRRG